MAVYRQVYISFWQDQFILDLTPEEKYFYIYLMTNSKTTQCGCYEMPKKIMELETGYNRETVDKLLNRFIDYGKIEYDETTGELLLINWLKYNPINNVNIEKCVNRELELIKSAELKKIMEGLIRGLHTPTKKKEKEQEKEQEKEEEQTTLPVPHENIKQLYHENCPGLRKVKALSEARKKHIRARWKQYDCDITVFTELFQRTRASPFLQGKNDRSWKPDFDWLMNEHNMAKVLEGKYDKGGGLGGGSGPAGSNTEKGEYDHLYE